MPSIAADILAKAILPTPLKSDTIRVFWSDEIRRRAFFSARTTEAKYLDILRTMCADVAEGRMDNATARKKLRAALSGFGVEFQGEDRNLVDLASRRRLDLIVDTQRQMAHGAAAAAVQGRGEALAAFPAWRLERYGTRAEPRDWTRRWREAGNAVGWEGACRADFVALKGSPIWEALGQGAGGFTDTLGNPYPPFAFSSGMGWTPVRRGDCARYGLDPDEATGGNPTLSPGQEDIRRAAERLSPEMRARLVAGLKKAGA